MGQNWMFTLIISIKTLKSTVLYKHKISFPFGFNQQLRFVHRAVHVAVEEVESAPATHTHTHTQTHTHTNTHTHIQSRTHAHTQSHTHTLNTQSRKFLS